MAEETLLEPAKVAKIVGKGVETVRRWIRTGKLRAVNLGGDGEGARWGVRRGDVDAFLAARANR
jgi:excisionase family DNA binding protein